ncbi:MAG: HDOD domain-containing protein [Desulfobacterales bacterium]|nr:HDOD domain-containing protein [Desulfobacterales bacterium]
MEAYLAKQPIFNTKKNVYAYELLFRDGLSNAMPKIDGDTATSKLLSSSFFTIGIDNITGGKKAFINFTQNLLIKEIPLIFPKETTVVEVLEDVEPTDEVISACQNFSKKGYTIALDDFIFKENLRPLIDLCDIIKIDFRLTPIDEVKEVVKSLSCSKIKFLAEKVETNDEFVKALDMGFDFFQGYFFSKPQIIKGKEISSSKLSLLQIMAEVNKKDFEFSKVEKLISQDVSISYKLLRYINSSFFKPLQEISSINKALILLGEKEVKRFLSLMILSNVSSHKPTELIRNSCIRGKFCELLTKLPNVSESQYELFILGLFSSIDAILDMPMADILNKLSLSSEIRDALISKKGKLSNYVNLIESYEKGEWENTAKIITTLNFDEREIPELYFEACSWSNQFSGL